MIYFTSDTHFGHDREFIYGPRGFKNLHDMENTIITNWNKTVKPEDEVYLIGDFFLGTDLDFVRNTIDNLNGSIHIIRGNHDTDAKIDLYKNLAKIIDVEWAKVIKVGGRSFYLSHYPTLTADLNSSPKHAVFNLFGHTHSKKKFYEDRPYMYNIAVDAHNFTPVSIDEINADIDAEIKNCIRFLV